MLEINLLPEEYRVGEGTPKPRFFTTIIGVAAVCVLMVFYWLYHWTAYRPEVTRKEVLTEDIKKNEVIKKDYDKLRAEITSLRRRRDALEELWQTRMAWSKKLDQLTDLVPSYVWLKRIVVRPPDEARGRRGDAFEGGGKLILECVSDSNNPGYLSEFYRVLLGAKAPEGGDIERSHEFAADFVALGHDGGKMTEYKMVTEAGIEEDRKGWATNITLFYEPPEPKEKPRGTRAAGAQATQ
jgi:Tfp pilus assembly protein PilN